MSIRQVDPEEHNQNVSDVNHVSEAFLLVGSIFCIIIAVYWASIFTLDSIVEKLSPEQEAKIMKLVGASSKFSFKNLEGKTNTERVLIANKILKDLVEISEFKKREFSLQVIPGKEVNAFAIPGDTILLVEELLEKVETENELAMVLGHELGHFHFRHHLKGMGRRLVMGFFSMMVFGEDNPLSKLFLGGLNYTDRKFNQQQETDCDLYGASLVFHKYGHLGGGLKFFERLGESEGMLHKYLSTHPLFQDRIKRIESEAMKQNWPLTGESIRLTPQKGSSSDSL